MITNKTNHQTISQKELICKSIFSQAQGLMFRRKENLIMIFPEERQINLHMVFVFFPIDVLVVNKNKKIVEIKRNFKPFRFWNSKEKGKYLVELAYPNRYEVGNKLVFKN